MYVCSACEKPVLVAEGRIVRFYVDEDRELVIREHECNAPVYGAISAKLKGHGGVLVR